MTKAEFLNALRQKLSALPAAEIERSINYYSEILDDRIEEGMGEEEAVASLEDPDTIARKIIGETPFSTLVKAKAAEKGGLKAWHIVLIVLGFPVWFPLILSFFILIFAFYLVIWSLILAVFALVASLGLGGLALLVLSPVSFGHGLPVGLFNLGVGLAAVGLAIFAFFPAVKLSKALIKLTVLAGRKAKILFIKKEASK